MSDQLLAYVKTKQENLEDSDNESIVQYVHEHLHYLAHIDKYEQEHLHYLADLKYKGFIRLTVDDIINKFWNPITKKGSPINIFFEQECNGYTSFNKNRDGFKMTPTGALLIGPEGLEQQRIEDWLSTGSGPYLEDSNEEIFYYLEFEEENPDSESNLIQISAYNYDDDENYMSFDPLDGVDCWYTE